jgi:hypothetical protein
VDSTDAKVLPPLVSEESVAVEDFLRWSASTPKAKKKRRFVDLDNHESCDNFCNSSRMVIEEDLFSSQPVSSSSLQQEGSCTNNVSIPSPTIPRHKTNKISERMLRAAALSGVEIDPVASLAHIVNSDRPTLKFEAMPSSTIESRSRPRMTFVKQRFVDPRKVSDFGAADFSFRSAQASGLRKSLDQLRPEISKRSKQKKHHAKQLRDAPLRSHSVLYRTPDDHNILAYDSDSPKLEDG